MLYSNYVQVWTLCSLFRESTGLNTVHCLENVQVWTLCTLFKEYSGLNSVYSVSIFRSEQCVLCLKYIQVWTLCTLFKVYSGWNIVYSVQRMFRLEHCLLCSKYIKVWTLFTLFRECSGLNTVYYYLPRCSVFCWKNQQPRNIYFNFNQLCYWTICSHSSVSLLLLFLFQI